MAGSGTEDSPFKGQPDVYVSSATDEDGSSRDQIDMARLGKKQELNVKKKIPIPSAKTARNDIEIRVQRSLSYITDPGEFRETFDFYRFLDLRVL